MRLALFRVGLVNPYLLIIFCTQVRHEFVKMITFGKVDLEIKTTKVKPKMAGK